MTLIDTGPLVALFDPKDADHAGCHEVLGGIDGALYTTEAVLTEAFHMLEPASKGAAGIKQFVLDGYLSLLPLDQPRLMRCFEYMAQYQSLPMDFADATLVASAEALNTRRVFTLDFADFGVYRIRRGHRLYALEMAGRERLE
jgi:predicted nucleic acid-binding protein